MKALSIVRRLCIERAGARCGDRKASKELALPLAGLLAACAIALLFIPDPVHGSDVLEQKFDGVVVPRLWVQVVPQVEGVITQIFIAPGQRVSKGDSLFDIDPEDFTLNVRAAQAELAEARARLEMAQDSAARQEVLAKQNSTSQQA